MKKEFVLFNFNVFTTIHETFEGPKKDSLYLYILKNFRKYWAFLIEKSILPLKWNKLLDNKSVLVCSKRFKQHKTIKYSCLDYLLKKLNFFKINL